MNDLILIKKAISEFPVAGDFITQINGCELIYKSGGHLTTDGQPNMAINDKVYLVQYRYDENKEELSVAVFHHQPRIKYKTIKQILRKKDFVRIERILKLTEILGEPL